MRNAVFFIMGASPQTPGVYRMIRMPDGQEKMGKANRLAHPYIHLLRRSGRSPALPYPPGR